MEGSNGWIKLHRKLLDWPWFRNPAVAHFWQYCLLKATHTQHQQLVGSQVVDLEPGQFVFGRRVGAAETGLSEQAVRTCLVKLSRCGSLKSTSHSTNLFSIITVCNWASYQAEKTTSNQGVNQPPTNLQPGSNQPPTTNKKDKNVKKVEKEQKEEDFPGDEAAGAIPVSSPEPKKPTKPKAEPKPKPKPREPKPWWDAVCDIFGMHAITKSDKSRIGKLARDFKAKCEYVGLGLDEIDARRDNLIAKWNDAAKVTPEALLKHWDLAGDDQNIFRRREPTPEEIAEHEAVCRGEIPA